MEYDLGRQREYPVGAQREYPLGSSKIMGIQVFSLVFLGKNADLNAEGQRE